MEDLTSAEVKVIAEEINQWNSHYPTEEQYLWHIHAIAHLNMPMEAYEVAYQNGYGEIWFRNEDGKLEPADRLTYLAPEYNHKSVFRYAPRTRKEEMK